MVREILAIRGLADNTTPAFRSKMVEVADRRGLNPSYLAAVMSFETRGTFSPTIRPLDRHGKPISSAIGLIQFLESTAKILGTTTDELSRMTAEEQLDYVEKHYETVDPHKRVSTIEDHYMAVFAPVAIGKPSSAAVYSAPSDLYYANKGLDADGDGVITKSEAAAQVIKLAHAAESKPRIVVNGNGSTPGPGPGNGNGAQPLASSLSLGEGAIAFIGAAAVGLVGYDFVKKKRRRGRR